MRWVRYEREGGVRFGVVEGDAVAEVAGLPFDDPPRTGRSVPLASVKLLPPVIPPTFYAAGINYRQHVLNAQAKGLATQIPKQADIGYRAVNALVGPGDAIVIPRGSTGKIEFEGELVVVIGRKAKHLSAQDALSCVFGYTIGNDISERTWQRGDRTFWRGKNADTFKPMGPWIETDIDLDKLVTTVRLNDKEVSRFKTNDMIFGIAHWISTMTQYLTLWPGDVIWMGTDDPTLEMVAGDTVEVAIEGIGALSNPVVGE